MGDDVVPVGGALGSSRIDRLWAVIYRELLTVVRTRSVTALSLAFVAVVLGALIVGEGHTRGFAPAILDLMTPVELVVPLFAIALSYRAILGDATRGELDLLRIRPLTAGEHVLGAFIGRAIAVSAVVLVTMLVVGILIAITEPDTVRVFATHETADSPVLFGRFTVLTILLGLVFVSVGLLISVLATSMRGAIVLLATILLIVVGFELAVVEGLATGTISDDRLDIVLGLGPMTAYRGLVLETAVSLDQGVSVRAASPWISVGGLFSWIVGPLLLAIAIRQRRA